MGCFSTGGRLERRGMNLFVLIALLLFVIGGFNLYQHHQTLESCTRVQGLLVDLHHNPLMNGHSSTLYPVFEYTVDGTLYRQEHRYQAVDGSELAALAENSDLPDGALNDLLKQAARAQPDFRIGESYPLLVSKEDPTVFFIEGQGTVLKEAKWFVMGAVLLGLAFLFKLLSHLVGIPK